MPTDIPPPVVPSRPQKRTRWPLYVVGILLALVVVIVGTAAITLWWIQRPIKPVVLSAQEKAVVEQKLRQAEEPTSHSRGQTIPKNAEVNINPPEDRKYVPGSKVIKLTEREVNGLLNQNTDLGKSVRLEFAKDAINAYLAVRIPNDFPVASGKMFRARGRFALSIGNGGTPYAVLEDLTVFGLSLPKAWLGGLKGENLLKDAVGRERGPFLKGVKSLRVEPGALVLEVED